MEHSSNLNENEEEESFSFRKRKYPFYNVDKLSDSFSAMSHPTYDKKQGMGQHLGGEYQYLMCGLYALKFSTNENILDFQITTNDNKYQVFDDIRLTVTFKDLTEMTFLFQLKHGEPQRNLAIGDFVRPNLKNKSYLKNPFYLNKHVDFIKTIEDSNIIPILFTNNTTSLTDGLELDLDKNKLVVKNSPSLPLAGLLVNTDLLNLVDILQLKILDHHHCFYIFSKQYNVHVLKQKIENDLANIMKSDISGFFDFIKNWWAGNFVLRKTDMLAKLTEFALIPFCESLSEEKLNQKSREMARIIMNFDITIVEDSNIITEIWEKPDLFDENSINIAAVALKFGFKTRPISEESLNLMESRAILSSLSHSQFYRILWYLDMAPLIVKINEKNSAIVQTSLDLWKNHFCRKKLIFIVEDFFIDRRSFRVFTNLVDLESEISYSFIVNNFFVSLQGRQATLLKNLLVTNSEFAPIFGVKELLEMTQKTLLLGVPYENPTNLYLTRKVSTIFVATEHLIEKYLTCPSVLIVINCEKRFDFNSERVPTVELLDYLNKRDFDFIEHLVILAIKRKCSFSDFETISRLSHKSVYLFQIFNEDYCFLLMKNSNELIVEKVQIEVEDSAILRHFNNHFNVISGSIGSGKTTLMKFLHQNSPGNFWSLFINLEEHKKYLDSSPDLEDLLTYFLKQENKKITEFLLKTTTMYVFLDGVADSKAIDLAKKIASQGGFVWISIRDESKIKNLNLVPLKIQPLDEKQQQEYIQNKLEILYTNDNILELTNSLNHSLDMINSRDLLQSPLNLLTLTEFLQQEKIYIPKILDKVFDQVFRFAFGDFQEFDYLKTCRLEDYKILALKTILKPEYFQTLHLKHHSFTDSLGIVENTEKPMFTHQIYADYFTALWFTENPTSLPKDLYFSEDRQNFRFIFDTITSEENSNLLAVIYRNFEIISLHNLNKSGRNIFQLLCSYGNRYPINCKFERIERDSQSYINLVENVKNWEEKDNLFNLNCVDYAILSHCLYPVEKILSTTSTSIDTLLEIYDLKILSYYICQLGFFNILNKILEKTQELDLFFLMSTAVLGCQNDNYSIPRTGNCEVIKILFNLTEVTSQEKILSDLLHLSRKNNCLDMIEFLPSLSPKINSSKNILHLSVADETLNEKLISEAETLDFDLNSQDFEGKNLLDRGVSSVNVADYKNKTPLHYAAISGNQNIMKFLIEKGATCNAKDSTGKNNSQELSELLNKDIDWKREENKLSKHLQTNLSFKSGFSEEKTDMLLWSKSVPNLETSSKKVYVKRGGTTNLGFDYELFLLTYLSLKLVSDSDIIDFQISSNDQSFGYFDDIVINVKTEKTENTYALQVKHFLRRKQISRAALLHSHGVFSLKKYFNSFQQLRDLHNCQFIYFTNAELNLTDNEEISFEDNQGMIKSIVKIQATEDFLDISGLRKCCRFEFLEHFKMEDYSHFFTHFFMYGGQVDVEGIRRKTRNLFEFLFGSKHGAFEVFFKFISDWYLREGKVEKLNKKWIQRFLAINLLNPFIKPLEFGYETYKIKLLQQALNEFSFTIFNEDCYDFIKLIGGNTQLEDLKLVNQILRKYNLGSITDFGDFTKSIVLWLLDICPLVITIDPLVFKIIDFLQDGKFILLGSCPPVWCLQHRVFQNLNDLKTTKVYGEILKTFQISVQDKEDVSLEVLLQQDQNLVNDITSSDLLKMLLDNYKIGGSKENLSQVYIPRFLTKNVIQSKYLQEFDRTKVFVFLSGDKQIDSDSNICFTKENFDFYETCGNYKAQVFHHFKIMETGDLEWISSKGGVTDLYQYQLTQFFESETSLEITNKIILVADFPGMGKTQLFKSLKNSNKFFSIIFTSNETTNLCSSFNTTGDLQKLIINIKFPQTNIFEKKLINLLLDKHQVIYFWDEIPSGNLEVFAEIIKILTSRSIAQFIAVRYHHKLEFEKKFSVLARRLRPLTEEEQDLFIQRQISDLKVDTNQNQIKSCLKLLKNDTLLGFPLQLEMLVEFFRERNVGNTNYSLVCLYNEFVEQKFRIYFQKLNADFNNPLMLKILESHKKTVVANYEKLAMNFLFPEAFLRQFQFTGDNLEEDLCNFLTSDKQFIHLRFAEFFAATFLVKTQPRNLEIIFEEKYTNLRLFFDSLLAQESELHLAFLRKDYNILWQYQNDIENTKDKGGRNLLHLACSWGQRYPVLKVLQVGGIFYLDDDNQSEILAEEPGYLEILKFLLSKCDFSQTDDLFKMTALQYAEKTNSIFAVIAIMRQQNIIVSELNETCVNLLYYSARVGFEDILGLYQDIPILQTSSEHNNLLHLTVCYSSFLNKLVRFPQYQSVINFKNKRGEIALHLAAQIGNLDSISILIENQSDINSVTTNGFTPLHFACLNNHFKCVKFLIQHKADYYKFCKSGYSPLHIACVNGYSDCVKILLCYGIDVNRPTYDGYTPLHLAASNGFYELVELLVENGASCSATTNRNETPLLLAHQKSFNQIVEFLQKLDN